MASGTNLAVRRVLPAVSPERRLAGEVQCCAEPHLEPVADRNAIFTQLTSGLLIALLSSRPWVVPST